MEAERNPAAKAGEGPLARLSEFGSGVEVGDGGTEGWRSRVGGWGGGEGVGGLEGVGRKTQMEQVANNILPKLPARAQLLFMHRWMAMKGNPKGHPNQ